MALKKRLAKKLKDEKKKSAEDGGNLLDEPLKLKCCECQSGPRLRLYLFKPIGEVQFQQDAHGARREDTLFGNDWAQGADWDEQEDEDYKYAPITLRCQAVAMHIIATHQFTVRKAPSSPRNLYV